MIDTISKMRALVNMKTTLIAALRSDLEATINKVMRLETRVESITTHNTTLIHKVADLRKRVDELELEQAWWQAQDKEMEAQALTLDLPVVKVIKRETIDLTEDPDAMWKKGTH